MGSSSHLSENNLHFCNTSHSFIYLINTETDEALIARIPNLPYSVKNSGNWPGHGRNRKVILQQKVLALLF